MAKQSKAEAHDAWRESEQRYREVALVYLENTEEAGSVDKKVAERLTRLRAKADKRLDDYLKRCLS